jgi:hypothetical protein
MGRKKLIIKPENNERSILNRDIGKARSANLAKMKT